jgi:hypothetical protein
MSIIPKIVFTLPTAPQKYPPPHTSIYIAINKKCLLKTLDGGWKVLEGKVHSWKVPELSGRLWRGAGSVRKALEGCWRDPRGSGGVLE